MTLRMLVTGLKRMPNYLALALVSLVLDQVSKYYVVSTMYYQQEIPVLSFFKWVRWHNEGAAFSFLAGAGGWQHWFFVALASGFSIYLLYEMSRLTEKEKDLGWVFALILGGALGNLADRLNHGYVVDFIRFEYGQYGFPAFNFADSSLFFGAALWIFLMLRERRALARDRSHPA